MDGVKIKRFRVERQDVTRIPLTLPPVWVADVGLKQGDVLEVYRTTDDKLVISRIPAEEVVQ